MNYSKKIVSAAVVAMISVAAPLTWAQSGAHTDAGAHRMLTPGDLKWVDIPSLPPGAKLAVIEGPLNEAVPFTFRLQLPANYQIPAHWHPAVERVTVISGTINMGVGDKLDKEKTQPLGPGSMAIMQPKTNHFVWTREEAVVQLSGTGPWGITYVNANEDPRKK
jgi:hypothetical protein